MGLSERDRAMLDFEGSWWTEPGTKEEAIGVRFALSATQYYRIMAALTDSADAAAYAPLVVLRLRRGRERRRRARYEGPVAGRRQR